MATYTPEDWLYTPKDQILGLLNNVSWPFPNVTQTQFFELLQSMGTRTKTNSFLHIAGTLIAAAGIVCTVLLICSLWRKAVAQKNSFYIFMLVIAFIDLIFNLMCMLHHSFYKIYKLTGHPSYFVMYYLLANKGVMFYTSCASDLCAVLLTLERYIGIAKAHFHRNLIESHKNLLKVVVSLAVIVVSAPRFHYVMDIKITASGSLYYFTPSEFGSTTFVVTLITISDVVLPIVLLAVMLVVSTLFRVAVMKRRKKQMERMKITANRPAQPVLAGQSNSEMTHVAAAQAPASRRVSQIVPLDAVAPPPPVQRATTQQPAEAANHDLMSIVVLTLSLDALFILNQIGYCAYFAAETVLADYQITYESTHSELATKVVFIQLEAYADLVSNLAEVISHSANFLLYMCLSGSLRQEFRAFLNRLF